MTITLDSSLHYWHRRPRSKKRRIRWKWYLDPKNWRPDPRVWERNLLFGSAAARKAFSEAAAEKGYGAVAESQSTGPYFDMHPKTWEQVKKEGSIDFHEIKGATVTIAPNPKPFPTRCRKRPTRAHRVYTYQVGAGWVAPPHTLQPWNAAPSSSPL